MKKILKCYVIYLVIVVVFLGGCNTIAFNKELISNPVFKPNTVFMSFEDLSSPKFKHLIEKYQLDTVVRDETDEFRRILLLRNWIKSTIKIDDLGPYPVKDADTEGILDAALQGQGFHCGHYMTVQNAIMNGYGYLSRTLGAGPGVKGGPDGHHGINEIWSNDYNKWFLSDAKYNHHFEKNGIPLSALEIRHEYLKNKARDIDLVKGTDQKKIEIDEEVDVPKEQFAQTYTWITWNENSNYFTSYPNFEGSTIMYKDDFYDNNTWYRDSVPAWIYKYPDRVLLVEERDDIEWTPNTITSKIFIEGKKATIELISDTPNLNTYQMKESSDSKWTNVENILHLDLKKKEYEYNFRTVNFANVTGPIHKIVIKGQ